MLPLRYQIVGHLMVGLLAGWLFSRGFTAPPGIAQKATPFTTQAGMLVVIVELHPAGPPTIISVDPLPRGRVSVTQSGDYTLSLLDAHGQILFELPFQTSFQPPGQASGTAEAVRLVFVVPAGPEAARLVVSGPHGNANYVLISGS